MKKTIIRILSLLIAGIMLMGALASCSDKGSGNETTESTSEETTSGETTSGETTSGETTAEETTVAPEIIIEGEYADTIMHSNKLSNEVQSYYSDNRSFYTVENLNMTLTYPMTVGSSNKVTSLSSKNGGVYLKETMDVFVETVDGKIYYASDSSTPARPNVYRIGYYYYDVHLLEQNFMSNIEALSSKDVDIKLFDDRGSPSIKSAKVRKGDGTYYLDVKINDSIDPYVTTPVNKFSVSTSEYNAISFSIKSSAATSGQLYFVAGSHTNYTEDQVVNFSFSNDGEYNTYTIFLGHCTDYTGNVTGLRLDLNAAAGEEIFIKDIKFVKIESGVSSIVLDRTLHTYSDKLHQELHFVANKTSTNIAAVGLITEIAVDTVDKLVIKDKNGLHSDLDGIDWESAEYVGFDIKNVGVFGYILPVHENSGTLNVSIADGNYVIKQTSSLASQNYTIEAPNDSTENDYRMGQRIYTDESHDFTAFLQKAEWERHPLETITSENFVQYDAIRGDYVFSIGGVGFNEPFFTSWNYHYDVNAIFESDVDRPIYVRTTTTHGTLENAVLLSRKDLVLPVELEVTKNFGFENEEPIFNAGDQTYGETIFPLLVTGGKSVEINVLNVYQNWGNFPIKQLSSIQFFVPYYHLSVGTTETSCIMPWYGRGNDLWTLPDFRAISSPYWFELEGDAYSNQPQHTHAGYQYFLQYTDSEGNYSASEVTHNNINSYGPIYAEVDMEYISYDGRIKVTYTHTEMPQTDEHRAYYTIRYEILEDVSFTDFSKDFSFYSFKGHSGYYQKMGYLNENNEIVHKDVNGSSTLETIILGKNCPYVSLYDLDAIASAINNNTNIGFVIANSDIIIGGEKYDGNFVVTGKDYTYSLSLNLGETTLKAGDTIAIDMIISPWGWYTSTDDSNMQTIRENSALDPITVTVNDGEKIESSFVPKVLSTNGKSAEFTLSGGANNVAVRVYGFEKLTAPKIYELIDGEWVEYVVSSKDSPDKAGNYNYYDGYYVYYDGDGTYSYAFVVNMDNVESRTFKIEADEDFKKWPAKQEVVDDSPTNVFVSFNDLYLATFAVNYGLGNVLLVEEEGGYVRYYGDGAASEAYATVISNENGEVTGQYVYLKYRIPTTVSEDTEFQFFTSTSKTQADGNGDNFYTCKPVKDGEWHVLIIDVASYELDFFKSADNGTYSAKHLRFDIFYTLMSTESYIDIAYIGMSDNIFDVCALEESLKNDTSYVSEIALCQRRQQTATYETSTGNLLSGTPIVDNDQNTGDNDIVLINPESGKTFSNAPYISRIDFVNGFGEGDAPYANKGGCSKTEGYVNAINLNGMDIGAQHIVLSGWTMVYGGWTDIVYSVDGGLTWINTTLAVRGDLGDASDAMIRSAENATGQTGFAEYKAGCNYQGNFATPDQASGLKADLSAYAGQTVNIIFAAVSAQNANELCPVAYIQNVTVPSAQ